MKKFSTQKKQTAVRGRSSALIVTVALHAVFLLLAGTYVAMEVVERHEAKFEAKQIARPKMKLKKLQVPVKFQKKMNQASPRLSARMTAIPKVDAKSMEFKMPETAGLGGSGLGGAVGFGGSLGFASTQIDLFGVKGSGEKIIFLLEAGNSMLLDDIGGIPAYTIIKQKLFEIVDEMPPTALFNVVVFDPWICRILSSDMLPATDANLQLLKKWIVPLNAQKQKYGLGTLGFAGPAISFEPAPTVFSHFNNWATGLGYAARKGADVVYFLGRGEYIANIYDKYYRDCKRGEPLPDKSGWPPELPYRETDYESVGGQQGWEKTAARAEKLYENENEKRLARGLPVRVPPAGEERGRWLVRTYLPDEPLPVQINPRAGKAYAYTAEDYENYIESISRKYSSSGPATTLGLAKKKFSFNVIHFVTQPQVGDNSVRLSVLSELADQLGGEYVKVGGGAAIQ